jgi:hypothetical protein
LTSRRGRSCEQPRQLGRFTDRIDPCFELGDLVVGKRSASGYLSERVTLPQRLTELIGRQMPSDPTSYATTSPRPGSYAARDSNAAPNAAATTSATSSGRLARVAT